MRADALGNHHSWVKGRVRKEVGRGKVDFTISTGETYIADGRTNPRFLQGDRLGQM